MSKRCSIEVDELWPWFIAHEEGPVYDADDPQIEMTNEELAEYREASRTYWKWQARFRRAAGWDEHN